MKTGKFAIFTGLLFFLTGVNCDLKSFLKPFVYKFGENNGNVVQVLEGTILPLVFQTYKDVKVPGGMEVSYVEVQVYSLSSPKVDYDSSNQQVSIAFSYTQLSASDYKIIVKAVPSTDIIIKNILKHSN